MPKLRVMVVDDSVVIRKLITKVIESQDDMEVSCSAANGSIAIRKVEQVKSDIITMDVNMPEVDGIEAVREIRKLGIRTPIVMLSSESNEGARLTLDILDAGADDFISKPSNLKDFSEVIDILETQLLPKLRALGKVRMVAPQKQPIPTASSTPISKSLSPFQAPRAIVVGSSTGGPVALKQFFKDLGDRTQLPIFVVQHMPPVFTENFANRLNDSFPLKFKECEDGDIAKPGHVYIAKGGSHMTLEKCGVHVVIRTNEDAMEHSCRPSADVLFRSAAQVYGGSLLGVVLTGMGQDGCLGLKLIREKGGAVFAQDEATSVVWGMPGAVVQAGIAHRVLPIHEMGSGVINHLNR